MDVLLITTEHTACTNGVHRDTGQINQLYHTHSKYQQHHYPFTLNSNTVQ